MEEEELDQDSIFRDMTFDEVLEELNARFLVNLPREEMGLVRVYWQAEQAYVFFSAPQADSLVVDHGIGTMLGLGMKGNPT